MTPPLLNTELAWHTHRDAHRAPYAFQHSRPPCSDCMPTKRSFFVPAIQSMPSMQHCAHGVWHYRAGRKQALWLRVSSSLHDFYMRTNRARDPVWSTLVCPVALHYGHGPKDAYGAAYSGRQLCSAQRALHSRRGVWRGRAHRRQGCTHALQQRRRSRRPRRHLHGTGCEALYHARGPAFPDAGMCKSAPFAGLAAHTCSECQVTGPT